MDLQHSCTWNHHLWAPWTKGKCPLCFILLFCPCWIPWSTASGIKMSMFSWWKYLRIFLWSDITWTWYLRAAAAAAKLLQPCPTLCNPIDCSSPGSPIPVILQARILNWVAISFSNSRKWKIKVKSLSLVFAYYTVWIYGSLTSKSLPELTIWLKISFMLCNIAQTCMPPTMPFIGLGVYLSAYCPKCTIMFMKIIPMHVFHCHICRT